MESKDPLASLINLDKHIQHNIKDAEAKLESIRSDKSSSVNKDEQRALDAKRQKLKEEVQKKKELLLSVKKAI